VISLCQLVSARRRLLPSALVSLAILFFCTLFWSANSRSVAAQGSMPAAPDAPAALSLGFFHSCVLGSDSVISCWGDNDSGQSTVPAVIVTFQQVTAGAEHTCGIRLDGSVLCWGNDANGSLTPPGGVFKSISGGFDHACGIKADDTLACWGDPEGNQTLPPSGSFKQVGTGDYHSCAIRADDSLTCWGNNDDGQATPPGGSFKQVSSGEFFTCAIANDDTVQCWGNNDNGQSSPPSGSFQSISAGAAHACGLRPGGALACWGDESSGQINAPLGTFVQVSAGAYHTCAIRSDLSILCWGDNSSGQAPTLTLIPTTLPNGNQGVAYTQSLTYTVENYVVSNPTYSIIGGALPTGLSLTANTGNIAGTPTFGGLYSFDVQIKDVNGLVGQRAYTLKINTRPVADSQSVTTGQNTAKTVTLTGSDAEGDPLIFAVVNQPAQGVLSGAPPNLIYTPNSGYTGPDSFTFKTNDGQLDSTIATVTVAVTANPPPNTPPVANGQNLSTQANTALPITLTGSDADSNPLTYSIVTNPAHGTLSGTPPAVVYTPAAGYTGPDSFTFKVNDGATDSSPATIAITVTTVPPTNRAPVANDLFVLTTKDTARAIRLTASDADNDELSFTVVGNPLNGVLTGTAPNVIYTPNASFTGNDQFTFKVNDGTVDSNIATVQVTIQDSTIVNTPPVANDQIVTTLQETPKSIRLTASDADGDPLEYVIVSVPTNGVLGGVAPNLIYTPSVDFSGLDSFTFRVKDGKTDSNEATVLINVTPVIIRATITGVVFEDRNGNGAKESNESGLVGVKVTLSSTGGFTQTVTTDLSGLYTFEQVPDGRYTLTVQPPAGYQATGPLTQVVRVSDNGIITLTALGMTERPTGRTLYLPVVKSRGESPEGR